MLPDCLFLESNRRKWWLPSYRCAVGVNFLSVGPRRELCRTCPIADWGQALACEHLEVYTFLRTSPQGTPSIQVQMECRRPRGAFPDSERCAICPEVHVLGSEYAPGVTLLGNVVER